MVCYKGIFLLKSTSLIQINIFLDRYLGDLELELERVLLEKSDVQEVLMKLETVCNNHEQEKQRLQDELKKVTFPKVLLIFITENNLSILDNRGEK